MIKKNEFRDFSLLTEVDLVSRSGSVARKLPEEFVLMASPQPAFFIVLSAAIIKESKIHIVPSNYRGKDTPQVWVVPSESTATAEELGKKVMSQDQLVIEAKVDIKDAENSIEEMLSSSGSEMVFLTSTTERKVPLKIPELMALCELVSRLIPPFNINLFPLDHVLSLIASFFLPVKEKGLSVITPAFLSPQERILTAAFRTGIKNVLIPPLSYHRTISSLGNLEKGLRQKIEQMRFLVKGRIKAWDRNSQNLYGRRNDVNIYGFTESGGAVAWRTFRDGKFFRTIGEITARESSDLNGELEFSIPGFRGGKFIRSRDIGEVLDGGKRFKLLGRKEQIIVRHEKEISIAEVEDYFLRKARFIKDIHISFSSGELKALVVADAEAVAKKIGVEYPSTEELERFLYCEMKKLNSRLPVYAQLDSFYAVPGIPYSHREKVSQNSSIF